MSEMMTFPDTWEEFEKSYGFTDNEEVYTNGARLIPSFRVKQWLDHLPSVQQEQLDCEDCIKHGGDWECDRVHCHKGDDPDTNVGELISRQAAIDRINKQREHLQPDIYPQDKIGDAAYRICAEFIGRLPSAQTEIIRCTECKHYREYDSEYVENAVVVQCMADRYPISETIPDGWFCAGAERKDDE